MNNLSKCIANIEKPDMTIVPKVQQKIDHLTKPKGSLGDLERIVLQLAAIQDTVVPKADKKKIVIMCADNGVVEEGVSPSPQSVTREVVINFTRGITGINVFARQCGAELTIVDIGVNGHIENKDVLNRKVRCGTANLAKGPAMEYQEAQRAVETGIELMRTLKEQGVHIIATGEMGVGNTTTAAAIISSYYPQEAERIVGRGAGIDDAGYRKKVHVVKTSISQNQPDTADPIDVIAKVGGLDIAGLAGCFLGAAEQKLPIVIDGFISAAAAFLAYKMCPTAKEYMIPSHKSAEVGFSFVMEALGLKPYLELGMRLGEGTGAALMLQLIDSALAAYYQMGSFQDANIDPEIYL